MEQLSVFGTSPKKLHRKNSIDTSISAAHKVDVTGLESMVYDAIASYPNGCTLDDVLDYMLERIPNCPYPSVSARFSSLIRKNLVIDTGERRKSRAGVNQRVLVITGNIQYTYQAITTPSDLSEFLN